MHRSMPASRTGAALMWAMLLSCGSATPPPRAELAAAESAEVHRYLPLRDGTVYSYDTSAENTGEQGVLIMQISRPRPGRADLKVGGKVQRLEIVDEGIRHLTGEYVLRAPIEKGSHWKGRAGRVEISAVDRLVEVPAGKFAGCIETIEEALTPGGSKRVTTVFCPDVGLVTIDVEAATDAGYAKERAVLKSFGDRVDIHEL